MYTPGFRPLTTGFPFSNVRSRLCPPGADPLLWERFTTADSNHSNGIDARELQQALRNDDWRAFDLDTVKLLMRIFDRDYSGTIGFDEFCNIWRYIDEWHRVFTYFDRDHSNSIDQFELYEAMHQFGFNLSHNNIALLEQKYTDTTDHAITFDRFVRACVVVKQITDAFQRLDTDRDGWIHIHYEKFVEIILRAP